MEKKKLKLNEKVISKLNSELTSEELKMINGGNAGSFICVTNQTPAPTPTPTPTPKPTTPTPTPTPAAALASAEDPGLSIICCS
ncbi:MULTISPECIES: hypothetical protein [Sphingobacterium]|uniref:hypothetical protein n=1 Tax=Sphingobacterium TaxID=28453 RepID=UPI00257A6BE2|nr:MULTISPECIES: hypothetical protein [Sphingobacterium]